MAPQEAEFSGETNEEVREVEPSVQRQQAHTARARDNFGDQQSYRATDKQAHRHPTIEEITAQEPATSRTDVPEISVDLKRLEAAIGRYLGQLDLVAPALERRTSVTQPFHSVRVEKEKALWELQPAPRAKHDDLNFKQISDIWQAIDVDGDGELSSTEAKAFLRSFLACPLNRVTLGTLLARHCTVFMRKHQHLKTYLKAVMEKDAYMELPRDSMEAASKTFKRGAFDLQQLCAQAISHACLSVAKKLPEMTKKFWVAMDVSLDEQVEAKEFKYHFQKALIAHVIAPIWTAAEARLRDVFSSGAFQAERYGEIDQMIKDHKRRLKNPNLDKDGKVRDKNTDKDNCGLCSGGDCQVM
eukprot:gnl/MRDRNA2_/MRDRNA2_128444_c0_seq1.p1 gnl/MRDRNA2_/MRDRNA2_128444_c0~~gnl/MRDRNA2_/MRDRNA2_128444_c0_seq1.p1  ORF type:complete len:357 (-),score=69.57 gnl/MRDRNA2_/MRDRNA2_128444_c0_seq1:145-1215(-)